MIIVQIILALCWIGLVACFVFVAKNSITLKHRILIIRAIRDYLIDCIKSREYLINCIESNEVEAVNYGDMESYDKTLWRVWDWGYTRILPKEKFEIIKPYVIENLKKSKEV